MDSNKFKEMVMKELTEFKEKNKQQLGSSAVMGLNGAVIALSSLPAHEVRPTIEEFYPLLKEVVERVDRCLEAK